MKITGVELHRYRLPLRAVWVSAAGGFSQRAGCLLRIATDDSRDGYGDCAPLPDLNGETLSVAISALQAFAPKLVGLPVAEALNALPTPSGCRTPAARCALETALLDLLAQADGLPLARYLRGGQSTTGVAVNAALGSLLQVSEQGIGAACADGFSVLKLKVGTHPVDQEIARLHEIAARLPAGTQLRLDANRAWHEADAARFLKACAGLPIEMFEEVLANPLSDPQTGALRRLQAACAFPLALDESLTRCALDALCAAPPVHRLVLKPPRFGGPRPTLKIAERAAAAGLQCVITSSIDSACGVLAAAHLAAALDNGLAHGLATSSWLAADTGTPPTVSNGRLTLPARPGLGFSAKAGLVFSGIGSR